MTSPLAHKKKYAHILLVTFCVSLVVFGFVYFFPTKSRSQIVQIITPFWRFESWVSSKFDLLTTVIKTKHALVSENETLRMKIETLQAEVLASRIIAVENHDLKQALGRIEPTRNFLVATILVKPNRSLYDTIVIDQGKSEGVVLGAHIYAIGVYPIGTVTQVFEHTALVSLYSTPGTTTTVRLANTHTDIDLLGRGGGSFEAKLPRDLVISEGELVVIPQFGNAVLALVDTVVSDERDPFKKVLFRSPVNVQELAFVYIAR